ncbi:hypothetical protein HXX76_011666 [Chlamydomonas incerta]|uniref:Uncharacterized protein n=1 Tax=Chlamydomonas incerta TaxID=51695 RepID=A0A835SDR0_CHLIN|nr:hypothetical protein HXX76_011666 [Chlamydomonas incerta]|eukprot:KAG2422852.1 hypothetical protein HXX76_011666 [Chlamydomonas incerta]
MEAADCLTSCEWKRLTPDLVRRIAESPTLHPNEVSTGLRLVDRDTAAALRDQYSVIRLGQKQTDPSEPHRAQQPWPAPAFVAHWGRPEPWRALTLPQRRRLLCLAASSGHAGSLDAALAHAGCALKSDVLSAAAAAGSLAACERLLGEGDFREASMAVEAAGQGGHMQVLQLLLKRADRGARAALYAVAVRGACAGGQGHVLAWMQDTHGFRPKARHALLAAESGQAAILEALLPQVEPEFAPAAPQQQQQQPLAADAHRRQESFRLLCAIALGCPLAVLQRHYDRLWSWSSAQQPTAQQQGPGLGAAGAGRGWAERQRDRLLMAAAASSTPDWAQKVDFLRSVWGPEVTAEAAASVGGAHELWHVLFGRADCLARLQHLHAAGVSLQSPVLPQYAAGGGQADALAFLWDEAGVSPAAPGDDCMCGAQCGEPAVLRFLHGRGFRLTALRAEREAQAGASDATLTFLAEVAVDAGAGGAGAPDSELAARGCWSRAFCNAAENGAGLAALAALRARGAAVDLEAVAMGGSEEALGWAAAELETEGGVLQAALSVAQQERVQRSGNTAAVEWLTARRLLRP